MIAIDTTGRADELRSRGADAVITDLREINVRTGDRRMSELPDGLQALDAMTGRHPAVFFDFDGTLSDIVENPDAAQLVEGAADALTSLTAQCPVAILSGRDLADVRQRIGLPGIWYAGSHGFELTGPDGAHHENAEAAASIPVLEEAAAELADQLGDIPVSWWSTSGSVLPCTTATPRVTESARWPRRYEAPASALRFASRPVAKSSSYVQMSTGTRARRCAGCSTTSAMTNSRVRCYRSTSATTSPTRTRSTQSPMTVSPIVVRHSDDGDRATAATYALDNPDRVREFTERLARQLAR